MQQGKKARRTGLFVVLGLVVIVVVGAVLVVPRLMSGSGDQSTDTIIAYATATVGDVSTTVAGSGTLAEASTDVEVPVGITITDVYVRDGDTVAEGDVLAAVDTDSVQDAIDLVNEEIDTLTEALGSLGESATLNRVIAAYGGLLDDLNALYSSGYIKATTSGTIGSVSVKKGDTVTVSTGTGSGSNGSAGSGGSGSNGSGSISGAAFYPSDESDSSSSLSFANLPGSGSGLSGTNSGSGSTSFAGLFDTNSKPGSGSGSSLSDSSSNTSVFSTTALLKVSDPPNNPPDNPPDGNDNDDGNPNDNGDDNEPIDGQGGYALSALPYATATVSQAKAACAASATATREEATRAYLINLCEAKAWNVDDPATPAAINVKVGSFAPAKGVYPIVFSSSDDSTVTQTTYVVLEDDATGGNSGGSSTDAGGANSANGTGGTDITGGTGGSGTGGTGGTGGSAANTAAQNDATEETVVDSAKVAAFQIRSDAEVEVQLQLDELDVAAVKVGQQATVEFTALEGQTFEGTVSSVSVSSGSYYAVITIPKAEDMYVGFSATATIVKEQATSVVLVPLDAVQQRGSELFVYTSATEDGELGGETVIETGLSDENTVEVLSGLSEGVTVYYQRQVTSSAASTGTSGFGQNQGGRDGVFSSGGGLGGGGIGGGGQMPNFGGTGSGPVQIPG